MMNKIIIVLILNLAIVGHIYSQSIRKDHREMIELERDAFINALYDESDMIENLGNFHSSFFSTIHFRSSPNRIPSNYNPDEDIFLPWHRYMIYELEQELQKHRC